MARIIVVNERRCMGCKTCEMECAMAHSEAGSLVEALRGDRPPQSRVHVEPSGGFGLPLQCRQCEDAPCMRVCPTEAVHRPDEAGPILVEITRCIGCKSCVLVCPFGVITLSPDGKATVKCDLCIERTAVGDEPACVAGCPTGALEFRELEDWLKQRRREAVVKIAEADRKGSRIAGEKTDER